MKLTDDGVMAYEKIILEANDRLYPYFEAMDDYHGGEGPCKLEWHLSSGQIVDFLGTIHRLLTELASLMAERQAVCEWEYKFADDETSGDYYQTQCENFLDAGYVTIPEHGILFKFCPFCGKLIEVAK